MWNPRFFSSIIHTWELPDGCALLGQPIEGAGKAAHDILGTLGSETRGPKEANPTSSLLRRQIPSPSSPGHTISRWFPVSGLQAVSLSVRAGQRAATVHWWQWGRWRRDVRAWIRSGAAGRGLAGAGGSSEQHRRVPHLFNSCRNSKELFSPLSKPRSSLCLLKSWVCKLGAVPVLKREAGLSYGASWRNRLGFWAGDWEFSGYCSTLNFQYPVPCCLPNRSKSSAWIHTVAFIFQSITAMRSLFTNPCCLQVKAPASVTVEVLPPFASPLPTALDCNGCYFYPL